MVLQLSQKHWLFTAQEERTRNKGKESKGKHQGLKTQKHNRMICKA